MYYADTDETHVGWEAQEGIRNVNVNENENQNENENENQNENEKVLGNPLRRLLDALGVTLEELRGKGRRRELADARSLVAAALMRQPFTRQQDVARLLGVGQSGVSYLLKRHRELMKGDPGYRERGREVGVDR